MPSSGQYKLRVLSARLREAGAEGQGLRRELYKAVNDAAKPLARKIADPDNLRSHMPNRYADVLAGDLSVIAQKSFGRNPGVQIRAKSRSRRRKVRLLDEGYINHPVYARGPRRTWTWANRQSAGMHPGFFSDIAKDAAPDVREAILAAMSETARKLTSL